MDHSQLKRIVITKLACKEFANQMLNRMSVYAFGYEADVPVLDTSRWAGGVLHLPHALYARYIGRVHRLCSLQAWHPPYLLPPSASSPVVQQSCRTLYLFGWTYRNPLGLQKYRDTLLKKFAPRQNIQRKINKYTASHTTSLTIGIHLKQIPYPGFSDGSFLISPKRTREILDEYLREHALTPKAVAICIVSDQSIPPGIFDDLPSYSVINDPELGFYALAQCAVLIGTNATSVNVPAWFGNIPHIVVSDKPIDWPYYRNKHTYFENKYATLAQGLD